MAWSPGLAESDPILRPFLPATGSPLHYALLYQPAESRARLRVVEVLRATLCSLPFTSSNADIAHARLSWWYEHLSMPGDTGQAPGHPLLRALQPGFAEDPALRPAFVSLVEGIARLQAHGRFANATERAAAWHSTHASVWHAHARICGFDDASTLEAVGRIGTAIALGETLIDLRRAVRGELAFICRDREPELPTTGAEASDALWYAALARRELPELTASIVDTLRALPAPRRARRRLRALRVMAALTLDTLAELAAEQGRVWEMRVELTPLRRLWRAWRVRVEA